MKVKILLSVIMSSLLMLAPCALAQRAGQDADSLENKFKNALERDGFVVTPGVASVANLPERWCANTPGVDSALRRESTILNLLL